MDDRLFILSLGRKGGSVIYGKEVINRIKGPKEVWISGYSEVEGPRGAKSVKTYENGLEFVVGSLFRLLPMLTKQWRALKNGHYKAFYTPYFHYWNLPFIMLFKAFGRKTVITVHDGIPHSGDGKFLEGWLNKACINRADEIIFLTAFVRNAVKKKTGFTARSHIIPHGLLKPDGLNAKARKHPGKIRLLFLGRLSIYKGIDLLIKAVESCDHPALIKATIAGKSQNRLKISSADPRIKVSDKWHTEEEISSLVNSHDILVLPYREATQSGVATIGISAAIPMICTKVGGLQEQLEEDEAVFVDPDVKNIQKGILYMLDDKSLYERISEKLVEKGKTLSWDFISEEVEKIIRG